MGHRPHKFPWKHDETDNRCVALKAVLAEQIAALVDAGFTQFLSGMAEATDTWSALSVLDLREQNPAIKLHCINRVQTSIGISREDHVPHLPGEGNIQAIEHGAH